MEYFSIIALIDLLYLNVFVPLTLSIEQVFLIALEVVRVCNKKGIDVSTLSPDQLGELITLSITSVKQVFKKTGFILFQTLLAQHMRPGKLYHTKVL